MAGVYSPPVGLVALNFTGAWTPPAGGVLLLDMGGNGGAVEPQPTFRNGMSILISTGWGAASSASSQASAGWSALTPIAHQYRPGWRAALPMAARSASAWRKPLPRSTSARSAWAATLPRSVRAASAWAALVGASMRTASRWSAGRPWSGRAESRWLATSPRPTVLVAPWGRSVPRATSLSSIWLASTSLDIQHNNLWGRQIWGWICDRNYKPLDPLVIDLWESGWSASSDPFVLNLSNGLIDPRCVYHTPSGPVSHYVPHTPAPPAAVVVPVLEVYIVVNELILKRVLDNYLLECPTLSLSIDADSWVAGFTASLPAHYLDEIIGAAGQPVELEATINGQAWRLLPERISRDKVFGKSRLSVSGRGIAAVLDAPYAPIMSYASAVQITAQQAAVEAVTAAGLPFGWSLDWQLTDWLLPAGLWSHQGTAMSAVNRIAAAAGGYVQADRLAKTLHVLHRYPVAPWDWSAATPDYELPDAVVTRESIGWEDKPEYNKVFVSGAATGGILGSVKRALTAGDLVAQMVTDDLITATEAASQRGLAILADTGRQARVGLSMPILPATGIIQPGKLVRYTEQGVQRVGLSRSVSVTVGFPQFRQVVEVETHE